MTSRRRFVLGIALGMLSKRRVVFAQQKTYRIAYLANDANPRKSSKTFAGFVDELQKLGWVEGRNLEISVKTSGGNDALFPQLVAEALAENVDVIVAGGSAATRAAKAATQTIPIVFGSAANPVEQKFVATLARPGGNVTGLALLVQELGPKRIELLKEILPQAKRFARLYDAKSISAVQPSIIREDDAAAAKLGLTMRHISVPNAAALEEAFASARRIGIDGVILAAAGLFVGNRERIAQLGLENRVPTMSADSRFAEAGALAAYGENFVVRYRRAAGIVDKILRGRKPSDIPVEESAVFEFVVNIKTAKALGIAIPATVLPDRIVS